MVETLTDNRNRTVGELRHVFDKHGGNLGENGCVSWMFKKRGYIIIPSEGMDEEEAMNLAIEAGAEDFSVQKQDYEIMTSPDVFHTVLGEVERKGIQPSTAEISMVPQNFVKLEGKVAQQMIKLMDGLDDHDDVQNVHANFDIEESELAKAI